MQSDEPNPTPDGEVWKGLQAGTVDVVRQLEVETEWLRRLLRWSRARLKYPSYQMSLDKYLAVGPSPAPQNEPPIVTSNDRPPKTIRTKRLEAVARLAYGGWDRWEKMHERQEAYRQNGLPLPSWPRDEFKSYLDGLRAAAEEALKDD